MSSEDDRRPRNRRFRVRGLTPAAIPSWTDPPAPVRFICRGRVGHRNQVLLMNLRVMGGGLPAAVGDRSRRKLDPGKWVGVVLAFVGAAGCASSGNGNDQVEETESGPEKAGEPSTDATGASPSLSAATHPGAPAAEREDAEARSRSSFRKARGVVLAGNGSTSLQWRGGIRWMRVRTMSWSVTMA